MNSTRVPTIAILAQLFAWQRCVVAQQAGARPEIRTYKTIAARELKAHIFEPGLNADATSRPVIVLFHAGGWNAGSPEWVYDDAKRFAALGLVAIAGEYRLSDQKDVTPVEAMSDARDLIRWVRSNAATLDIDPRRVAAYGYSAGGHLAFSAAVFTHPEESKTRAVPDALILLSPAVSIVDDQWPQVLLGKHGNVRDISPAEHIVKRLPPMIVIEGAADTETPLAGVQEFCDRATRAGGICELHAYAALGHILSRNLDPHAQEQGPFDPDPVAVQDSHAKEAAFLRRIGFVR